MADKQTSKCPKCGSPMERVTLSHSMGKQSIVNQCTGRKCGYRSEPLQSAAPAVSDAPKSAADSKATK